MTKRLRILVCVLAAGVASNAIAGPEAKPAAAAPAAADDLSDDTIFTRLFASRDYCKKIDAANAAAYDKGLEALTADSVAEAKAFQAKPDFAAMVAKSVAEFEAREKDPAMAGSGKSMCENYLKMQ